MFRSAYVNAFSYVLTLIIAGSKIYDLYSNPKFSFWVVTLIVFLVAYPFLYAVILYFYQPFFARFFKILPPISYYITKSSHEITIQQNGHAHVITDREMIFFSTHKKWELYDIFYVDGGIDRKKFLYNSTDAVEIDRKWIAKDRVVIFWQPKEKSINILEPYKHNFSWTVVTDFNETKNHWNVIPPARTGQHTTIIKTLKSVNHAVSFRKPWHVCLTEINEIYDHADQLHQTGCTQPTITNNNQGIILLQKDLNPRHTYVLVFTYDESVKTP